ncbi:MAG: isoprenyl transferase [Rhodospirillales bacterium]|jgi:undecaprenyl diphosphate synthase|tara:strand:+ start:352 stop:1083 length:732 start_codon:yes stop_codon:yes gene_type:complete
METASHKIDQTLPPPVHVAIIMDGNGRWAMARGLPRSAGHKRGAESVRKSVKGAILNGVSYLTLFGFSSENWKRPPDEIRDLMGLLRLYLKSEIKDLHKEGVRLLIIGDRVNLDKDIIEIIQSSEEMTKNNTRLTLIIALSYGGRAEILHAAKQIGKDIVQGDLQISDIDEDTLSERLFTKDIPDPDLLIRTSGEQRLSNFLLWQCAYTEFIFVDTLWPDFAEADFESAIKVFQNRERRYGTA